MPSSTPLLPSRKDWLALAGIMVVALLLARFHYAGISLSDEYLYTERAWQITQGTFTLTPSAFDNRFGWLLLQSFFLLLIGPAPFAYIAPSCIGLLLLIFSAWKLGRFISPNAGWLAAGLLAPNPGLLDLAGDVSPDLLMTGLSAPALILFFERDKGQQAERALLTVLLLFLAFCTKISVLYLAPWLLFYMIRDLRAKRNRTFIRVFFLTGILLFAAWLLSYYFATGDPLYRWHGIETEHNLSEWSYYGKPLADILARITYYPFIYLLGSAALGFLLIGTLPVWNRRVLLSDPFPVFWGGLLLFLLVIHWFGSTSFHSYNPLLLYDRMWLLLVLPATLLFTYVLVKGSPFFKLHIWILIGVTAASIVGHFVLAYRFPWFWLTGLTALLLVIGQGRKALVPALLVILVAAQLVGVLGSRKSLLLQEYAFFEQLNRTEKTLVITDQILKDKPLAHLSFLPPGEIKIIHWREWEQYRTATEWDSVWMLYNPGRELIMSNYFGWPIPPAFRRLLSDDEVWHVLPLEVAGDEIQIKEEF